MHKIENWTRAKILLQSPYAQRMVSATKRSGYCSGGPVLVDACLSLLTSLFFEVQFLNPKKFLDPKRFLDPNNFPGAKFKMCAG